MGSGEVGGGEGWVGDCVTVFPFIGRPDKVVICQRLRLGKKVARAGKGWGNGTGCKLIPLCRARSTPNRSERLKDGEQKEGVIPALVCLLDRQGERSAARHSAYRLTSNSSTRFSLPRRSERERGGGGGWKGGGFSLPCTRWEDV